MSPDKVDHCINIIRDMEDSLKVSIKIGHNEVLELVVTDLIKKRNCPTNKIKDSFDKVLLYYLGVDDFEKYIINKQET